jgi:Ca2+-binding EF-hand superfamily protein
MCAVAHATLSRRSVEELEAKCKASFDEADVDKSGTISKEEFVQVSWLMTAMTAIVAVTAAGSAMGVDFTAEPAGARSTPMANVELMAEYDPADMRAFMSEACGVELSTLPAVLMEYMTHQFMLNFKVFDVDGDGTLNREEIKPICTRNGGMTDEQFDSWLDAFFEKFDEDGDGIYDLHPRARAKPPSPTPPR